MTKLNEKEIIDLFISKLKPDNAITEFGKDDVAILSLKDAKTKTSKNNIFCPISIILKCDMLVGNTDVPTGMKPWQIQYIVRAHHQCAPPSQFHPRLAGCFLWRH